jgi:hypothetical protein
VKICVELKKKKIKMILECEKSTDSDNVIIRISIIIKKKGGDSVALSRPSKDQSCHFSTNLIRIFKHFSFRLFCFFLHILRKIYILMQNSQNKKNTQTFLNANHKFRIFLFSFYLTQTWLIFD